MLLLDPKLCLLFFNLEMAPLLLCPERQGKPLSHITFYEVVIDILPSCGIK
jgi:hypothetical protein